eukprot:7382716-Prymnesium_polylepis.2
MKCLPSSEHDLHIGPEWPLMHMSSPAMPPTHAVELVSLSPPLESHVYILTANLVKRQWPAFSTIVSTVVFHEHVVPTGHGSQVAVDATNPLGRYRPGPHTSQLVAARPLEVNESQAMHVAPASVTFEARHAACGAFNNSDPAARGTDKWQERLVHRRDTGGARPGDVVAGRRLERAAQRNGAGAMRAEGRAVRHPVVQHVADRALLAVGGAVEADVARRAVERHLAEPRSHLDAVRGVGRARHCDPERHHAVVCVRCHVPSVGAQDLRRVGRVEERVGAVRLVQRAPHRLEARVPGRCLGRREEVEHPAQQRRGLLARLANRRARIERRARLRGVGDDPRVPLPPHALVLAHLHQPRHAPARRRVRRRRVVGEVDRRHDGHARLPRVVAHAARVRVAVVVVHVQHPDVLPAVRRDQPRQRDRRDGVRRVGAPNCARSSKQVWLLLS